MSASSSMQAAGPSGIKLMTRKQLFEMMLEHKGENINKKLEYLENVLLNQQDYSDEERRRLQPKLSNLKYEFKRRWLSVSYKEETFKIKYKTWLQGTVEIPIANSRRGRPIKSFSELTERSKRRKTENLRRSTSVEELSFATQTKLRTSGLVDASAVLKQITKSPTRATKYRKMYSSDRQEGKLQLPILKALSIFIDAQLSRDQYEIIRRSNKKLYPCYSLLQKAKKECYPIRESYAITATSAETNLQDLLDHTITRLLLSIEDVINSLPDNERTGLELISKWGCDGSQQAQFKQKFENNSDSDANIFQSSLVPLQLICTINKKIIWRNPTPSSPRYCRPIRIRFIKESVDITNEEVQYIQTKINALKETKIEKDISISIKHTMLFTMIDAKICNAVTNTTSTMKCYICGGTSKDFNNISATREVCSKSIEFGLSILHARIRIFEHLLHLSYKLPVKKWQIRAKNEKDVVEQRKKMIQDKFKSEMGIIVDVPKPGFGNTNDGNTSRRFFTNHELSAAITGIDVQLIYKLKIILEVISRGNKINMKKFTEYAKDTAAIYVQLYPWHPMSPTLHKILIHGPVIIENAILPIGQLSEEAAEARNKYFRLYRQYHARKCSRESCNIDVLNRLLLSSDPLLSSMRSIRKKKKMEYSKESLDMFLPSSTTESEETSSEEESMDVSSDED